MANGQVTDDQGLGASSRREKELKAAVYVLNEELFPALIEGNLDFLQEKGPIYNEDKYQRHLCANNDDNFPEGVKVKISEEKEIFVNEAHSLFRRTTLGVNPGKKTIKIDYTMVNPAYIFPPNEEERFLTGKDVELHRYNNNWGVTNPSYSAFDSQGEELTMSEMIKFMFDGYNYEFKKMVNRKGEAKIFLEVGQWDRESETNKVLRKSVEMTQLDSQKFEGTKSLAFKAIEKAKAVKKSSK